MNNNNRIAVIIPYFGKWPEWIELFFFSCAKNKHIDWYFFTDCQSTTQYSNLHFLDISFTGYCKIVSEKLQINYKHQNPYRICSLRPFYAIIHSDILEKYEFWGYGDVDVIWGDITKFYDDKKLDKYDVFSTHADRLSGHFTLIRNTTKYNNLCFKIQNWKEKLCGEKFFPLDEQDFSWLIYPESKYVTQLYAKIIRKLFNWRNAWVLYYSTITPIYNILLRAKNRRLYFKEQHTTPILYQDGLTFKHDSDKWFYNDGKIINSKSNMEYIYLHFMIFKKNGIRKDFFWENGYYKIEDINNDVCISRDGFHPLMQEE